VYRPYYRIEIREAIASRDVATVALDVYLTEEVYVPAEGSSKRKPGDNPDVTIGSQLALARALRNAADKIERDVWFQIEGGWNGWRLTS